MGATSGSRVRCSSSAGILVDRRASVWHGQQKRQPGPHVGDRNPVFAATVGVLAAELAGREMGQEIANDLLLGGEGGVCCREFGFELVIVIQQD
jgi:hypothetical protein